MTRLWFDCSPNTAADSAPKRGPTRQRSALTRAVAGALLGAQFGCTSFGPVAPKEYIPIQHPAQIWVTRSDNSVVKMQLPKLLGDTLVGYINGDYQEMM